MEKLKLSKIELNALAHYFGTAEGAMALSPILKGIHNKVKKLQHPSQKKAKQLSSKDIKKLVKRIVPATPVFTPTEFMDKVMANIAATNSAAKN